MPQQGTTPLQDGWDNTHGTVVFDFTTELAHALIYLIIWRRPQGGLEKYTNRITRASTRVPLVKGERNVRDALTPTVASTVQGTRYVGAASNGSLLGAMCF